ncbi:MAG TPA: DNA topoisomerase IB [Patescibacteria group bacterium]|nr:DNA topoisomerase IB [Patescibacteria group bacterium]
MAKQIIVRIGGKNKFRYKYNGKTIMDEQTLKYIDGLKIPPAWKNVEIAKNPNSKVLATGYDNADRKQYIYHPKEIKKREARKYDRLLTFVQALPKIRRVTGQHLKRKRYDRKKVMATIVRLIDQAYFRVGNDKYAQENNSYGVTTLRTRHLTIKGGVLIFAFEGKSGQKQHTKIKDNQLAKIVRHLDELPGYEIFKYYDKGKLVNVKSSDLNEYIREISGEDITAKDFRTWAGTLVTASALAKASPGGDKKSVQKEITTAIKQTAKCLGNTPAIALGSYIDPRIIENFRNGHTIAKSLSKLQATKPYLSKEEYCVLKLLSK